MRTFDASGEARADGLSANDAPIPILERLAVASNVPSLPSVPVEILQMMRADDVPLDALVAVIQKDPALAAKLLRTVNSAMFGRPRTVTSIRQAVVTLGLRAVKVMVLSFALVDALQTKDPSEFDYAGYWRRSITTATAAQLLARAKTASLADEAFVAGLLTDIGIITAWRCAVDLYRPVLSAFLYGGRPIQDIEKEELGITHAEIGGSLLRQWNLPASLCDAVGAHHGQGLADLPESTKALATLVYCAARVASVFCNDVPASELGTIRAECLTCLGLTDKALDEVLTQLDTQVREVASLLSVQSAEIVDYQRLQAEAAIRLTELTLQGEVDRATSLRRAELAQEEVGRLQGEKRAILEVASTDGLTGIANRAAFDQRLHEKLNGAKESGHAVGLVLLDVDYFKRFNDAHGHQAGDQVLREVAACLRTTVGGLGFVARYGGEEFAAIFVGEPAQRLGHWAEQIRQAIERHGVRHGNTTLHVTASLGAACACPASVDLTPEELVERADRLLYRAKHAGRNRVMTE